ncbi:efflux RND transporter periplasmic adaptor subunit [Peteryoungia ipomoeae]|uniref:Efflux RND transporter periplasmic adaptor subunit n=1 Tax=Peteryoungia ipomoeae TaxID=1210932 RepID=A0A4V4HM31_9HYPH|nr:efflux RND transporter periplasmic adaptor subunit [Peteryoungia ipomoeae]THV20596.1 efflux RND transporter periplasmic adaptor subunit [Peteryoungia ipomoeae]
MRLTLIALLLSSVASGSGTVLAADLTLEPREIVETKAVYGQVQPRNSIPARARIGGTVVELSVTEGDQVETGDVLARVKDDKIGFQIDAVNAQLSALEATLRDVNVELERAERLLRSGTTTAQRLDQLTTQRDVTKNQILAAEAQRSLLEQQAAEGAILAPADGMIVTVPVTEQSVVMPGETIATVAGGGLFLRLSIPERHASDLRQGAGINIALSEGPAVGRLAKIYPAIEGGRVTADVEIDGLDMRYIGARLPVDVPVGTRQGLFVPSETLTTRVGVDFVRVRVNEALVERVVVAGDTQRIDGEDLTEIISGLQPGDIVVTQ